ncbi:MAG TPA: ATP-binding protein [Hanamia sp.]
MRKSFLLYFCFFGFVICKISAQNSPDTEITASWNRLKQEVVTEKSFRAVCDLMQQVAKTNLSESYSIFTEYLPKVKATGNVRRIHVLLMGWGRAKESLNYFADAENLFSQARKNAIKNPLFYHESLVGTILLYLEWNKKDSLEKYLRISEAECIKSGDKENLSFTYTFKAMVHLDNADTMNRYLTKAISLAKDLPDKNDLFTARYNYAVVYCQNNPQKEVFELDTLLQLSNDSSLNHYPPKLYERTNFSFRNARPSIYYNLMQVNLLLTDYDNAERFAQLFYDATITPHPDGVQAPYFNAEMSIVKSYHNEYRAAQEYLDKSRKQFAMPENKIPYISYFIAAGMLQEHQQHYAQALAYYDTALHRGNIEGLYLMPPDIYYAHALILTNNLKKAEKVFSSLQPRIKGNKYSAIGFYYYKYDAGLLKAQHDFPGYVSALQTFYEIKDSLTSLKRYRAIEDVETKYRVREQQQKLSAMQNEELVRIANMKRNKIFYISLISLTVICILLLLFNIRHRQIRNRQNEILQQNKIREMQEQSRISQMKSAMDAEENERRRIADKLHDDVGAMLSLATINLSSVLENNKETISSERKLNKVNEILSSVSVTVRGLSHELTPLMIEKFGFKSALKDLASTINLSEKIKLEMVVIGFEITTKYSPLILNNIYRIAQELLHNIIAHANATNAILELVEHSEHISLMVEDNGSGIKEPFSENGLGLNSIQSKIEYFNGAIEITNKQEGGTLIVIEIPV